MERPPQPLARTVGLRSLQISHKVQWLLVAFVLAMPVVLLATFMCPSGEPGLQTFFLPGRTVGLFQLGYARQPAEHSVYL